MWLWIHKNTFHEGLERTSRRNSRSDPLCFLTLKIPGLGIWGCMGYSGITKTLSQGTYHPTDRLVVREWNTEIHPGLLSFGPSTAWSLSSRRSSRTTAHLCSRKACTAATKQSRSGRDCANGSAPTVHVYLELQYASTAARAEPADNLQK